MPFGVKANVKAPHRFMRHGALVWVILTNPGWSGEHIMVRGLSRGGRPVTTWMDARDLRNFRVGWISGELRACRGGSQYASVPTPWSTRDEAQAWADGMNERFGDQPVRPHAAARGGGDAP